MKYPGFHAEILAALAEISRPTLAKHVGPSRGSDLEYLGVRFPARRELVKSGFSFYEREPDDILDIWDDLWRHSPNGDVLFCALDYYQAVVRKTPDIALWSTLREWVERIENWAHSDSLCSVFSYLVEADPHTTLVDVRVWNQSERMWLKRISLVSLIHYTEINAIFLPKDVMFSLIGNCLSDHSHFINMAVGWILREMHDRAPQEVEDFLGAHLGIIAAPALSRCLGHTSKEVRAEWRRRRKQALS